MASALLGRFHKASVGSHNLLYLLTQFRFDSREICDEIVRKFNGIGIGEEGLPMNIRYADTPAQKELKRVTAERRQFRTNEYNIGAYGTPLVGLNPALYNQQAHWRRNLPQSRRFASGDSGVDTDLPLTSRSGLSSSSLDDTRSSVPRAQSAYGYSRSIFAKF